MKVAWPNYHYDFCREASFIFRQFGWEAGILRSSAFPFFGMGRSITDPEGFSRLDYEPWIAESLGIQLFQNLDDIANLDAVILRDERHRQAWMEFANANGLSPAVIAMYIAPPVPADVENMLTCSKTVFNAAGHVPNRAYYTSVFSSVALECHAVGSRTTDKGFYSYINRYASSWPEAYRTASLARRVYEKISGQQDIRFYGQQNADGMLRNGRYGQPDEMLNALRSSIGTLHIKDTDVAGRTIMRTMLLGKPLILWRRLVENTGMQELLNDRTCYLVSTPEDIVRTLFALERNLHARDKGRVAAEEVRRLCSWDRHKMPLTAFFEKAVARKSVQRQTTPPAESTKADGSKPERPLPAPTADSGNDDHILWRSDIAAAPEQHASRLSIESTAGGEIRLHWRNCRISLSKREFRNLASTVRASLANLGPLTDADGKIMAVVPPPYLKKLGDQARRILRIETDMVRLKRLQVQLFSNGAWRIRPLESSPVLTLLQGRVAEYMLYHQRHGDGPDPASAGVMLASLIRNGYPYKTDYIVLHGEEMLIRDGQHRAAMLYWLYGDIYVDVIRVYFR